METLEIVFGAGLRSFFGCGFAGVAFYEELDVLVGEARSGSLHRYPFYSEAWFYCEGSFVKLTLELSKID